MSFPIAQHFIALTLPDSGTRSCLLPVSCVTVLLAHSGGNWPEPKVPTREDIINGVYQLAQDGLVDAMQAIYDELGTFPDEILEEAAFFGQLGSLKYLHEKMGYKVTDKAVELAATMCPVCFEYLISKGGNMTEKAMENAMKHGIWEIIKFIYERGVKVPADACARSIYTDDYDIDSIKCISWLRSQGFPLTEETAMNAAIQGKDVLFTWLLRNGCPITIKTHNLFLTYVGDRDAFDEAFEDGNYRMFKKCKRLLNDRTRSL